MEHHSTDGQSTAMTSHADTEHSVNQRPRFILATLLVFAIWLLLTASLQPQELATGLLVALITAGLTLPRLHLLDGLKLGPALPWYAVRFLGSFLVALWEANIDMARRVLTPRLRIEPGIVAVHTELRSPLGRLLLANAITLTPGTLSVDVIDDRILVHWIDISPGQDIDHATRAIAADFERHLLRFVR